MTIVKSAWRELLILQLIGAAVTLILQGPTGIYQAMTTRDLAANRTVDGMSLGPFFTSLGLGFIGVVVSLFVASLVTLASVHVVVAAVAGGRATAAEALRGGARRLLPLIGWELLASVIILAGLCACLLPAVYFAAVFLVLAPVVAFERVNPIGRCFKLFHNNVGVAASRVATIFALFIGTGLVSGALGGIVKAIMSVNTGSNGTLVVGTLITTALTAAVAAVVGVLTGPLTVTAYADMRSRIEPLSTPVLAREVQAP
jgi:hypothetical protein